METVSTALPGADAPAVKTDDARAAEVAATATAKVKEGEGAAKTGEEAKAGDAPVNLAEALAKKPEEAVVKTEEQKAAEAATGLDLTPFADEFVASGKLSDKSYEALKGKGISREVADTYVAGLQAQVAVRNTALSETVGGVDTFNSIIAWGASALTDAEKEGAVKVLSGRDVEAAKTYLMGLNARFVKENGKDPSKRSGGGGGPAEDLFKSRSEQAAAMRDARYARDAKYRAEVTAKSIRSFGGANGSKKRVKPRAKKTAARKTSRRARAR